MSCTLSPSSNPSGISDNADPRISSSSDRRTVRLVPSNNSITTLLPVSAAILP